MPQERRDTTTGVIIANKANWIPEEIMVWLDYQDKKDKEEYNTLESEFRANGNRYTEDNYRGIQNRVAREVAKDSEQYILQVPDQSRSLQELGRKLEIYSS